MTLPESTLRLGLPSGSLQNSTVELFGRAGYRISIADRAYDSDAHRMRLAQRGIELICPHRRGRKRPPTQDGRPLRRYRKRWKIERAIAWFSNFRRLVVRYERKITVYQAFFHVACVLIALRQF